MKWLAIVIFVALAIGIGILLVRERRQEAAYDRAMAACLRWATTHVYEWEARCGQC